MPSDAIPPSFEPGSGRRIPPKPATVKPPTPKPPADQAGTPAAAETAARPIPVRRVSSQVGRTAPPPPTPPRSRTDPSVNATRAVPIARPAQSAPTPGGAPGAGPGAPGGPRGPLTPAPVAPRPRPTSARMRAKYRRRRLVVAAAFVLVLALAWPIGLVIWADGKMQHVEALTGGPAQPGTTYLIAGSDSRADGAVGDQPDIINARTDTVMLLTAPARGTPSLVSIPRDVPIDVPGYGKQKLNAAYTFGGPQGLVAAVEGLTGITVDHYVEIGMLGVEQVVDAVGGVNLCWDAEVNDPESGMVWTPGCHDVDGARALAFARMRKADPTGDIGRVLRQRMVVQAVFGKLRGPKLLEPATQVRLINAATGALATDPGTGIVSLGRMALTFRNATGPNGFQGVPPIADLDYRGDGIGSTVLLDPETAPLFWQQVLDGTLPKASEGE